MSEEQPPVNPWRVWLDNPWTQAWIGWQRLLWASHPMSRLVPLDVDAIYRAFAVLGDDLAAHPDKLMARTAELLRSYNELALWSLRQGLGAEPADELVTPDQKDRRFRDETWASSLVFSVLKQSYLVLSQWLLAVSEDVEGLEPLEHQRSTFYMRQFVDAVSPSNYLLTNPTALRETLDTGGENLRRGLQNLLDDLERGEVKIAGREQFTVGQDLALTPGQVIYRNDLVELIQYTPATEEVHAIPILIIPPWINKYYIMDISPGRSMVEYLAQQGFTVFLMSWRNPTPAQEDMSMEDYLRLGPLDALEVVKAIAGSPQVNWIGYCLGGTLLAITLAYLAAIGDNSTNCATFFTALQDFSEVGETSLFVTEEWITEVERRMDDKGYLDGLELSSVFKLMRANDLIWSFVVNNYLLGQEPMSFDLLYWSVDRTRMPRAMHSFYLRNMYVENNLVQPGRLTFLGQGIDLSRVRCPSYVVATVEDYIVPWQAAHKAAALFSGPVRRILSAGGHQTGIINPPSDQAFYLTNDSDTVDSEAWLQSATRHAGSWWPDWAAWLGAQSGKKQSLPSMGNDAYPPLVAAPGTYVFEE